MGEVYRARHTSLNTHFAVKLLAGASAQQEATRARFLKEAQITAQLKSRHAVTVFDFGVTEEGRPYLVMELLQGETLMERVDRGRMDPIEAIAILRQCARALDRAHQLGIVHRDFKPANVILSRDEEGMEIAKVLDFGVAKILGELEPLVEEDESPTLVKRHNSVVSFTKTGALLGTPAYMAPEQIDNALNVGPAADLWALGVVAYEALVGLVPFPSEEMGALFASIKRGSYVPPSQANARLPPEIDGWFARACATSPPSRFASAAESIDALGAVFGADPHAIPLDRSGSLPMAPGPRRADVPETLDAPKPLASGQQRFLMDFEDSSPPQVIEVDVPRLEHRFGAHLERASAEAPESMPMTTLRGAAAILDAPPPSSEPERKQQRATAPRVAESSGMPVWVFVAVGVAMAGAAVGAYFVTR